LTLLESIYKSPSPWYTPINHNLFPARRGVMTEKQEIRAKSLELAIALMGLVFESPMVDAGREDEVGEFNNVFKYVKYFEGEFEKLILKEPPDLPKP
jgi:hypothetical protein